MTRALIPALFLLVACGGDSSSGDCVEDEFACDGTVLQQCVDGVLTDIEDCAVEGGECMAEMGHCHMDSTMDTGMEMR